MIVSKAYILTLTNDFELYQKAVRNMKEYPRT